MVRDRVGWGKVAVGVAGLLLVIAAAAYALNARVAVNGACIDFLDKRLDRIEKKVDDIWKVFYESRGRRRM